MDGREKLITRKRLLALRDQQARLAELELARLVNEVARTEDSIRKETQAVKDLSASIMSTGSRMAFTHLGSTTAVLQHRLNALRQRLAQQTDELLAAQEHAQTANREKEALAKLVSQGEEAARADDENRQVVELDDLSIRKWMMPPGHGNV